MESASQLVMRPHIVVCDKQAIIDKTVKCHTDMHTVQLTEINAFRKM